MGKILDTVKDLVKDKEDIVIEEIKTVKMLVPMSFELKDGFCIDEETQALYEFLIEREDVEIEEPVYKNDIEELKVNIDRS